MEREKTYMAIFRSEDKDINQTIAKLEAELIVSKQEGNRQKTISLQHIIKALKRKKEGPKK